MTGNPTFRELLRRCRETAIACMTHQDTSFDRLVETVNPKRHPGRNPLFQVNYRMQGVAPPTPELTGLRSSRMVTDTGAARFDLAMGFVDGPGVLRGYVEYNKALFDAATITGWAGAIPGLVEAILADPGQRLDQLAQLVRSTRRGRPSTVRDLPPDLPAMTSRRIRRAASQGPA